MEVGLWGGTVSGIMGWHHLSFPQVRASTGIDNVRPFRTLAREGDGRGQKMDGGGGRRELERKKKRGRALETMKSSLDICEDS